MKEVTPQQAELAARLVTQYGGIRKAAKGSKRPYTSLHNWYRKAKEMGLLDDDRPVVGGSVHSLPRVSWPLPPKGKVSRYIFTCAQNNTRLHAEVWENLTALAKHYGARICVSTFTYDKASYGQMSVKRGKTAKPEERDRLWYAPQVEPYILDESVIVAPGLIWCGELNILPTAVRPLSGYEAYTGRYSGIFPHVKFALNSVASGKHEGVKLNYTTGTVTQRNYIAKSAGFKAQFHHGYGALLVEVDAEGNWFCRQLNADSEGTIYDLTLRTKDGRVTDGHRVEAITWGDIHVGTVSPEIMAVSWGRGGMLDTLKPKLQFMHDVLDFRSRNHHDRGDPHKVFRKHVEGQDDVLKEIKEVAEFLHKTARPWASTIVVSSNHDNALLRWLREADYRSDPKNALFFLEAQLEVYRSIHKHERGFHLLEWAMRRLGVSRVGVRFLRTDESLIICRDANGGIECGMHGHLGPDGTKGNLRAFAKMGRKSNTGHAHGAAIEDGAYRGGVTGDLDQGYNAGPSSWSHSDIITYPNGKRAIVTKWGGKWRA